MPSHIKRGESILIPFRNSLSIEDSQMKPRMYKTKKAFEKAFPKHYLGTDGVELVEYAEMRHARWEKAPKFEHVLRCSECKDVYVEDDWIVGRKWSYCPNCGAKME